MCQAHLLSIVHVFILGGRNIAYRLQQPLGIKPGDPVQGCILYCIKCLPWALLVNHFSLEKPYHAFCKRVAICVTDTAYGGCNPFLGKPIGVADGEILASMIAVVNECSFHLSRPYSLLECIQGHIRSHRLHRSPADYHPREGINDECYEHESRPGCHIREVGNP